MKSYEECKEIAKKYVEDTVCTINSAYELPDAYVFDNSSEIYAGIVPFAVIKETGKVKDVWGYLEESNLTMDDMEEIEY